jgi:hypothetical protein
MGPAIERLLGAVAFLTLISTSAMAQDRVLFLKCRSPNIPNRSVYTTIDYQSKTAKVSNEPADEREWNSAEFTDVVIKWQEHYPKSDVIAVFNRYTGRLNML